jgi:hypothetical protein
MKYIFCTSILMLVVVQALAQNNLFSHGVNLCIPQNALASSAKTGWGTSFRYERILTAKLNATGSMSVVIFGKKSLTIATQPSTIITTKSIMIPIQVGLKYYIFQPNHVDGLFVNGETGLHVLTGKTTINNRDATPDNETDFSYSISIGYKLRKFEISYKQQFISSGGKTIDYSDIRLSWFLNRKSQ